MTSFTIQGWCPSALRPMLAGDGLVVRLRPAMARLTAIQSQGLARAALTHGNGLLDLTSRGNIQLRGVRPETHLPLLDDLAALDLLDPKVSEVNLTISPFWTGDPWQTAAQSVTKVLADPEFANLPSKFGVALDIDRPMVLQSTPADIHIEWHREGWLIRPDAQTTGALAHTVPDLTTHLRTLLHWFLPSVSAGRGRMAALAGHPMPTGFDHPMTATTFHPHPGPQALGHLVGLAFGQLRAETLAALATTAIRITPWRMILIEGAQVPDLPDLPDLSDLPDLIATPDDPLLNVTACTGAPGCPQALQPTRDLARRLAPQVPPGQHLHVSGCAKGCAHPAPANVTLTATAQGFTLIRNGRAADPGTPAPTNPFKAL